MIKSFSLPYPCVKDETLLQEIADAGFTGIDLAFFPAGGHYPKDGLLRRDALEKNMDTFRDKMAKYGLVCNQVHFPVYDIFASSEMMDEEVEACITNTLHAMAYLGVKWGAFHPMSSTNFAYDRKRAMHDNRERLKKHLETAEKLGVGIAVENIPVFPDCPQYQFFTSVVEDHMELVDSLYSDKIGICWDFGHANLMPYDKAQVLDMMGSRVKILHIHSNYEQRDLHICPGLGTVNWDTLMPILKKHGFSGDITLEVELGGVPCRKEYLAYCGAVAEKLCAMF